LGIIYRDVMFLETRLIDMIKPSEGREGHP